MFSSKLCSVEIVPQCIQCAKFRESVGKVRTQDNFQVSGGESPGAPCGEKTVGGHVRRF
jgi:hypothetical protein